MVFEFEFEPRTGCVVLLPLVEHMTDVGGKRHEPDQMFSKEPLAPLGAALYENATRGSELDRAVLKLSELQDMERLGDRKQIVDLEGERAGDLGQFGMASVRRSDQGLDEPADAIDRDLRQNLHQSS